MKNNDEKNNGKKRRSSSTPLSWCTLMGAAAFGLGPLTVGCGSGEENADEAPFAPTPSGSPVVQPRPSTPSAPAPSPADPSDTEPVSAQGSSDASEAAAETAPVQVPLTPEASAMPAPADDDEDADDDDDEDDDDADDEDDSAEIEAAPPIAPTPPPQAPTPTPSISFATDIHPILIANCGRCHASGRLPNLASGNVDTAFDVAVRESGEIVELIADGEMPADSCSGPPGSNGCVSVADFDLIAEWIDAGMPR